MTNPSKPSTKLQFGSAPFKLKFKSSTDPAAKKCCSRWMNSKCTIWWKTMHLVCSVGLLKVNTFLFWVWKSWNFQILTKTIKSTSLTNIEIFVSNLKFASNSNPTSPESPNKFSPLRSKKKLSISPLFHSLLLKLHHFFMGKVPNKNRKSHQHHQQRQSKQKPNRQKWLKKGNKKEK